MKTEIQWFEWLRQQIQNKRTTQAKPKISGWMDSSRNWHDSAIKKGLNTLGKANMKHLGPGYQYCKKGLVGWLVAWVFMADQTL